MICDRPDRGPKGDIVYGPQSASRRHWLPFGVMSNQLSLSDAHSGRRLILYRIMSSFKRSGSALGFL